MIRTLLTATTVLLSLSISAQTVTNGSVTGTAANSGINGGMAPGWSGCSYSPDVCDVNRPSYVTTSQVTPSYSPDGGTWLGLASMSPAGATECAQTTITGLTVGQNYTLTFWAACFGTATSICNNSPATPIITVGAATQQYTIPMAASTWTQQSLPFTATATTMVLEAKHASSFGGYYAYVGLDGFEITLPLPVELSQFDLNCSGDQVEINWATSSENNNDYFTIERSSDGVEFEAVQKIDGSGTSMTPKKYTWTDTHPLTGTNYYRLSQTDFDGRTEVFQTRSIKCDKENAVFIYPNPFNEQITVTSAQDGELQLIDLSGKVVFTSDINAGENVLPIQDLFSGAYTANIQLANGDIENIKLVKTK